MIIQSLICGSVSGLGMFVLDALDPLKTPEGWGQKKWLVLSQNCMIAGFLIGTLSSICLYTIGNGVALIFSVAFTTASLLSAYFIKQYTLLHSIEKDTEKLELNQKKYASNIAELNTTIDELKIQVSEFQASIKEKERLYGLGEQEILSLKNELDRVAQESLLLQVKINEFKKMPALLEKSVSQVSSKIEAFLVNRQELNQSLQQSIIAGKEVISTSFAKLDEEEEDMREQQDIIKALTDQLLDIVDKITLMYEDLKLTEQKLSQRLLTSSEDLIDLQKTEAQMASNVKDIHLTTSQALQSIHTAEANRGKLQDLIRANKK